MQILMIAGIYATGRNKEPNGFRLMDIDTNQVMDVTYDALYNVLATKKADVINVAIEDNKLKGINGTFDRYAKIIGGNLRGDSKMVVVKEIGDVGYEVCDHTGKRQKFSIADTLTCANTFGIANGKVVNRTDGTSYISPIAGVYLKTSEAELEKLLGKKAQAPKNVVTQQPYPPVTSKPVQPVQPVIQQPVKQTKQLKQAKTPVIDTSAGKDYEERLKKSKLPTIRGAEVSLDRSRLKEMADSEMSVEQKLARGYLVMKSIRTFYYAVMQTIKKKESIEVPTMAVSLDTMYYNVDFVKKLELPELVFVELHEIAHIMMKHNGRRGQREPEMWNVACDLYINKLLCSEFNIAYDAKKATTVPEDKYNVGIKFATGGLYDDTVDTEKDTPESIYAKLEKESISNTQQYQPGQSDDQNQQQGQNQQGQGQGQQSQPNQQGQQGQNQQGQNQQGQNQQGQNQQGQNQQGQNQQGQNQQGQQGQQGQNQQGQQGQQGQNGNQSGQGQQGQGMGQPGQGQPGQSGQGQGQGGNQPGQSGQSQGQSGQSGQSGQPNQSGNQPGQQGQTPTVTVTEKTYIHNGKVITTSQSIAVSGLSDIIEDEKSKTASDTTKKGIYDSIMKKAKVLEKQIGIGKGKGHYGVCEAFVDEALIPKINWKTLLMNRLSAIASEEKSLSTPDRRFVYSGTYVEGRREEEEQLKDIKITLDTSGSMSDQEIAIAFGQIRQLLKTYKVDAEIIFWDDGIQDICKFDDYNSLKLAACRAKGRGGTNPNCVFELFNSKEYKLGLRAKPELIIMFTDGGFNGPDMKHKQKYGRDTIWVISGNSFKFEPPFGKVAKLRDD